MINGHKINQSDLPGLVNLSKAKVSDVLCKLEKKRVVQRVKAGRTLEIQYIYNE